MEGNKFSAGGGLTKRNTGHTSTSTAVDPSPLLPVGDLATDVKRVQTTNSGLTVGVVLAILIGGAALIAMLVLYHTYIVRTINGVGPAAEGEVTLTAGDFVTITPDTATNSILISSTGQTTLTEQSQDLTESDANGPEVAYHITMTAVPENTWRVTTSAAFPGAFVPGIETGDGGQGNVAGTAWTAPSVGEYAFNAHCAVTPSAYIPQDYMSSTMAISLGATSVDPTTGRIPPGGRSTLDLSVGSNGATGPPVASVMTTSAVVHVCPTCLVVVGDSVTLHTRLDHVGPVSTPVRGTTSTYGILAGTSTTTVGATNVTGDLGVSPGNTATGPFTVSGTTNLGNGAAATAQVDRAALFASLDMPCTTILQGTDLGGLTLGPGVYCYTSSGGQTGTLTLDGQGNPNAQFIFKFGTTLTTAASAIVLLTNGAQACNVYWRIGSSATFGATNTFLGTVVAAVTITVGAGGTFDGPLLAGSGDVTFAGASTVAAASTACATGATPTAGFDCFLQVSRMK